MNIFDKIKSLFVKKEEPKEEPKKNDLTTFGRFNDYVERLLKSKKPFLASYTNENEKIELCIKEDKKVSKKG